MSVDPGNASGARTPSRPNAAITVTDSHEAGAEPTTRSPRRPAVGGRHRRGDPRLVHEHQVFRLDSPHLVAERAPLLPHLGPIALAGVQVVPSCGSGGRRRKASHVFRRHVKPTRCLSCSNGCRAAPG